MDRLRPTALAVGIENFEAMVVVDGKDPAWIEPTRPPRLLLTRRALGEEPVARFATARALFALRSGVPLVEGHSPEDVMALIRAAALLFLPDLRALKTSGSFVHAWQAELAAMGLMPELLPEEERSNLEGVLAACVVDSSAQAAAATYAYAERLSCDRAALAITGDLRAGLVALCPRDVESAADRAEALVEARELAELVHFATAIS
jgi:hypothetical protein